MELAILLVLALIVTGIYVLATVVPWIETGTALFAFLTQYYHLILIGIPIYFVIGIVVAAIEIRFMPKDETIPDDHIDFFFSYIFFWPFRLLRLVFRAVWRVVKSFWYGFTDIVEALYNSTLPFWRFCRDWMKNMMRLTVGLARSLGRKEPITYSERLEIERRKREEKKSGS